MKILHVISSVDPRGGGPIEGVISSSQVWFNTVTSAILFPSIRRMPLGCRIPSACIRNGPAGTVL